jgi:hypothetical protein
VASSAVLLNEKLRLYECVLQVGKCYKAMFFEVKLSPRFSFEIDRYLPLIPLVVTGRLGSDRKFGVTALVTLRLTA